MRLHGRDRNGGTIAARGWLRCSLGGMVVFRGWSMRLSLQACWSTSCSPPGRFRRWVLPFLTSREVQGFRLRRVTFFAEPKKVTKERLFLVQGKPIDSVLRGFFYGTSCPLEKRRTSCAPPSGSAEGGVVRRSLEANGNGNGKNEAARSCESMSTQRSGAVLAFALRFAAKDVCIPAMQQDPKGGAHGCAPFPKRQEPRLGITRSNQPIGLPRRGKRFSLVPFLLTLIKRNEPAKGGSL